MFTDYYLVLDIPYHATDNEVRAAYKKQAIKWHPDKNPGRDTTDQMQLINEAYLILKDIDARKKYDQEYLRFRGTWVKKQDEKKERQYSYAEYDVQDPILYRWMQNARKQAADLAKQAAKEFADVGKAGVKGAVRGATNYFIGYLIVGIILSVVFSVIGRCQ